MGTYKSKHFFQKKMNFNRTMKVTMPPYEFLHLRRPGQCQCPDKNAGLGETNPAMLTPTMPPNQAVHKRTKRSPAAAEGRTLPKKYKQTDLGLEYMPQDASTMLDLHLRQHHL